MTVNEKMTAIADKIRSLLGISGAMGLDAMATNLATEQTNIANAFTAIGNKGGTVPSAKVSGNLVAAIDSIKATGGASVQRKNGSFTTDANGAAAVNCGFKPDLIVVYLMTYDDIEEGFSIPFGEQSYPSKPYCALGYHANGVYMVIANRGNAGFSVSMTDLGWNFGTTKVDKKTFNYIAVKYTE